MQKPATATAIASALLLENRPAFLFHWFALNALGVSVVPINAEMRSAELDYLIGHSEIGLAVTLPQRAADLRAAAARAGVRFATMTGPMARCRLRRSHRRTRAGGAIGHGDRVRAALHLGHHRPAQGLPC